MENYRAYGLTISSELAIPELEKASDPASSVDVQVHSGPVPAAPAEDRQGKGKAYRLGPDEFLYVRDECGRFLIRHGNEILVEPDPGVDDRVWRLSLFGPALGLLLIQRGLFVLHGGAVAFPEGAVLLLGASGRGKSTLTGELCRQGGRLLTDDVVAIDMKADTPLVLPGVPLLKLWPDSVPGAPGGTWTKLLHPKFEKMGRRVDDGALAVPTPLNRAFLLAGGETLSRQALDGAQAFRGIMASQFAARYGKVFVQGLDQKKVMEYVTRFLGRAPVEILRRPQDRSLLEDTGSLVIASLAESGQSDGSQPVRGM